MTFNPEERAKEIYGRLFSKAITALLEEEDIRTISKALREAFNAGVYASARLVRDDVERIGNWKRVQALKIPEPK